MSSPVPVVGGPIDGELMHPDPDGSHYDRITLTTELENHYYVFDRVGARFVFSRSEPLKNRRRSDD